MEAELQTGAYAKFWDFYTTKSLKDAPYLSYEEFKTKSNKTMGFIYDGMEEDFTREIINSLNRFSHEITVTEIWSKHIIPTFNHADQLELSYHFLELPLNFCLNQAQSIRDRIIYCSTHLCHQANLFRKIKNYKDDLPSEFKINKNELKKRITNWSKSKVLLDCLEDIASTKYVEATKNYRNMSHHRVPPSLEHGHTNFITRLGYQESSFEYITFENGVEVKKTRKNKGVSYGFGGIPPLKAVDLLELFKEQHCLLIKCFCSYWQLICEHHNYSKLIQNT